VIFPAVLSEFHDTSISKQANIARVSINLRE
jgi:hypothetical protein